MLLALPPLAGCSPPAATLVGKLPDPVKLSDAAESFTLGSHNTTAEAEVSAGATFTITFSKVAGTLKLDPSDPTRSELQVTVNMHSGSSTPEVVADIAMGPAFLNADAHPNAELRTRRFERRADSEYEALGELTLHGVTQGLRMPTEIEIDDCHIRVLVAFSFDRHAFEIQTEGSLETLVSDTVAVRFEVAIDRRPNNQQGRQPSKPCE